MIVMTEEQINDLVYQWNEFIEEKNKRIRLLSRKKDFIEEKQLDDLISLIEKDNPMKVEQ